MAAAVGRTTRGRLFGIALCFLAALFFVESKTTWADNSNHSPIDISAAKAGTIDRSFAKPACVLVKQPVRDHSAPALPAVLALIAFLFAPVAGWVDLFVKRRRAHFYAFFPYAHFVRPPPAL